MKVKGCIRRTVAGLMIGLTLFSGYSATYMQASVCEAAATTEALYTLFYLVMGSLGRSCGSKAQNSALCDAFCSWFDELNETEAAKYNLALETMGAERASLRGFVKGQSLLIASFPMIVKAIKVFITKVAPKFVPSSSKYQGTGKADYNSATYFYKSGNIQADINHVAKSYGLDILDKAKKCSTTADYNSFINEYYNSPFYGIEVSKSGLSFKLYLLDEKYLSQLYPQGSYVLCNDGARLFITNKPEKFAFNDVNTERFKTYRFSRSSVTSDWSILNSNRDTAKSIDFFRLNDAYFSTFGYSCPMFESYSDVKKYVLDLQRFKAIEGLYGDDSASFDIPQNYSIAVGDTSLSDSIADAVSQALEKSSTKTLTSEEVSAIVSSNIVDYSEQLQNIADNTEELAGAQVMTNTWLSKIYNKICEMSATDGSSALDLDDVTEQFKVMEGGGQPDNDDNEPPKIWGVGAFTTVKLLEPVFKFFGEPLSLITKWLNSIQKTIESTSAKEVEQAVKNQQENDNAITNVIEVISDFPMKIYEQFKVVLGNIIIYLDNIATAAAAGAQVLTEFPLEIVQWISQGVSEALDLHPLEVTIPDVKVDVDFPPIEIPILSDILAVLEAILEAVRAFFIIDTAELEKAMDLNKGKIEKKLPFEPARELFAALKFSDSYDYPILKIQSPGIIKQFTQEDYIILFDGKNFADYFKLVRGLLVATLWFGYAYCIVCKFRVRFTLD